MTTADEPTTVREFCLGLLENGALAAKLRLAEGPDGAPLDDSAPGEPVIIDRPARAPELAMGPGAGKLPGVSRLDEPAVQAQYLQRFAHHELMAAELFAWALVTWPDMPGRLRRGMLRVLIDEQRHLGLYVARLRELSSDFGGAPHSDYLWKHAPAMREGGHGPLAFLCAMGLTFEQGNLDHAGTYAQHFRNAGDTRSAEIMELVHREEIAHVRLAAEWLDELRRPGETDVEAYRRCVPFPLSAARAKGKQFDEDARRRAGLSDSMIEHVRAARPYDRRPSSA